MQPVARHPRDRLRRHGERRGRPSAVTHSWGGGNGAQHGDGGVSAPVRGAGGNAMQLAALDSEDGGETLTHRLLSSLMKRHGRARDEGGEVLPRREEEEEEAGAGAEREDGHEEAPGGGGELSRWGAGGAGVLEARSQAQQRMQERVRSQAQQMQRMAQGLSRHARQEKAAETRLRAAEAMAQTERVAHEGEQAALRRQHEHELRTLERRYRQQTTRVLSAVRLQTHWRRWRGARALRRLHAEHVELLPSRAGRGAGGGELRRLRTQLLECSRQGEAQARLLPTKPCRTRAGDKEWRNGRRAPTQDPSTNDR